MPGTDPKAGTIVIGGHLDSWDLGTGAIDDGAGVAITAAAAKRLLDGPRPRRTIRVVWFGAEEPGGFGGEAYAKAHATEKFAMAGESDFGADSVWRFNTNLPDSAKAIGDRLAAALAPLGIVRGREKAGDGTDVGPLFALGASRGRPQPERHCAISTGTTRRRTRSTRSTPNSCARTSPPGRPCCGLSPTPPRIGIR